MKPLVFFFFMYLGFNLSAQSFQGKITTLYQKTKSDLITTEKINNLFGKDFFQDSTLSEYLIKDSWLNEKKYKKNGTVKWEGQQRNDTAMIYFDKGIEANYSSLSGGAKDDLLLVKKHKKYKYILGFKCRKHEYVTYGGKGNTTIIGWIAEDLPFDKEKQFSKIFTQVFLPDGIPLERIVLFKKGTIDEEQVFKITKIELFDVSDDAFEFYFPKK